MAEQIKNDPVAELVQASHIRVLRERREFYLFNSIIIYIKDALPSNFDMSVVIKKIEDSVPSHLVYDIESIYVGQFDELEQREVSAAYLDGAIYVTNEQTSVGEMVEDIVHEIAHAAQRMFGREIYFDMTTQREFLRKRENLFNILQSYGYDVPKEPFMESEYSVNFDRLLYDGIGYDRLALMTADLFVSPYAATSLEEYFANGFTEFFLGDSQDVARISPELYEKIVAINKEEGAERW
tara:strand:- start:456 stop:1172 length:717 start_codon:yes stop_codon:yes gene_type:complete